MEGSPLAQLPFEVRESIYQYAFAGICADSGSEKWTTIDIRPEKPPIGRKKPAQLTWYAAPTLCLICHAHPTAILYLCRQIHEEASLVYWTGRTLSFILDSPGGLFKEVYSAFERVAAICCVRNFLIGLARRRPYAIRRLKEVNIRIYGFAGTDMSEMFDIVSQVQMLLTNWRSEISPIVPIFFSISDFVEFKDLSGRPWLGSRTPVEFRLPIHSQVDWKEEVQRGMTLSRFTFSKLRSFCDVQATAWSLDFEEWCLTNYRGDDQGCSLQSGCHCEKHAGRSQLALKPEKDVRRGQNL